MVARSEGGHTSLGFPNCQACRKARLMCYLPRIKKRSVCGICVLCLSVSVCVVCVLVFGRRFLFERDNAVNFAHVAMVAVCSAGQVLV